MNRRDRVELAVLGLVLLAWGLVLGPLLHRETHGHGHRHEHGPSAPQQPHGAGSLEHQALDFVTPGPMPVPIFIALALPADVARTPSVPTLEHRRRVEQSQAP